MNKTVLISLPVEEFQALIVYCVKSCLTNDTQKRVVTVEQSNQLLSIQEAAVFLRLTVPTLYSKHSKGEIPGVCKRGKRLYFDKQALIDWIKSSRKKTNAEIEDEVHTYLKKKGGNHE